MVFPAWQGVGLDADQNFTLLITVQPWFPQVGGEVLLIPEESKEKVDTCSWFRWDTAEKNQILVYQPPPVKDVQYKASYTGRESVNTDCSLQIKNISVSDITYYIMQRNTTKESEVGQIFLVVIGKCFTCPFLTYTIFLPLLISLYRHAPGPSQWWHPPCGTPFHQMSRK
uniref:Immunoglobulin V-set domain-containing protein n=1 Tax=Podarcis muralis TaxID=64176 RepID=A0A670ITQ1_PODMU